jgi:GTP 3',8-cyclase
VRIIMGDSKEPSIVYWLADVLYLNITNSCSNNCWFCFRNYKKGVGDFNLKLVAEPEASDALVQLQTLLKQKRWREFVFCGFGEPTARLDIVLDVTSWIKRRFPASNIRLDTNGHGYALNENREVVSELKVAGVNEISVSLNGFDDKTYTENCRPLIRNAFLTTIDFIRRARRDLRTEVTAVRLPDLDIQKIRVLSESLEVPFLVRDYVPCFW